MNLSQALRIQPNEVISIVGAGGKTTTMFQLATELAATQRVLTTTTTRIFATQAYQAPAVVTFNPLTQTIADLLPQLNQAIDTYGQVLFTQPIDGSKAPGIPPETIDLLAQTGLFDCIIVEADGSRQHPFKAPAEHEPVIPESTTLVIPIVGLDILGKPLTSETVHRPELVSHLTGLPIGQPITSNVVATVLSHAQGGLKNKPPQARVIPLLNKFDIIETKPDQQTATQQLIQALLTSPDIEAVLLGTVHHKAIPIRERYGRIAAIVLAAGGSTRFGSPKQLAEWQGQPLLTRAVKNALAASVDEVILVLGACYEQCLPLIHHLPVKVAINSAWATGQSSSMQVGLATISPMIEAVLFMLVDLPQLTSHILNQVITRYRQTGALLVWPEYAGQRGNPVLFDQTLFTALKQVQGDTGGRPVLQAYQQVAERVIVDTPAILYDVDHVTDLTALQT